MTTQAHQSHTGALSIAAIVFAVLLPPVGIVLGIIASRKERSGLSMAAIVVGVFALILEYLLLVTFLAPEDAAAGEANPAIGMPVMLVILAVVAVVFALVWRAVSSRKS